MVFKTTTFPNQFDGTHLLFAFDTNSQKLKVDQIIVGLTWVWAWPVFCKTLKLTVSEEWKDGIN